MRGPARSPGDPSAMRRPLLLLAALLPLALGACATRPPATEPEALEETKREDRKLG